MDFLQFLRLVEKPVSLVAHNGFQLDAPLIMRDMKALGLWQQFDSLVYGFTDTFRLLKSKLIERKAAKLKFNQEILVHDFVGDDAVNGAHNALTDVKNLEPIVQKTKGDVDELTK